VEDLEWEREGTGTRLESGEWEKRRGGKRSGAEYLRPGQIVLEGKLFWRANSRNVVLSLMSSLILKNF
jgi:hypothetical protein